VLIVQLTDTHVVDRGELQYGRFDTNTRLSDAVAHVNRLDPVPDVAIVTGDLVENGSSAEYQVCAEILSGLSMPYYVIAGNHDSVSGITEAFAHIPEMPAPGAPTIDYVVDRHQIRLVALDTSIPDEHGGRLTDPQLMWLEETLSLRPGAPTLLMIHHPPFVTGIDWMDRSGLEDPDALEAVVARHSQIGAVVCGHLHSSIQASFGGTIAMTSSSTSMQIALALGDVNPYSTTNEDAAVTLHYWQKGERLVTHRSVIKNDLEIYRADWSIGLD